MSINDKAKQLFAEDYPEDTWDEISTKTWIEYIDKATALLHPAFFNNTETGGDCISSLDEFIEQRENHPL